MTGGKGIGNKIIDPCGRTWMGECDHKGRGFWDSRYPPVIGSASLDRGLSEWHPVGCSSGLSLLWRVHFESSDGVG